MLDGVTAKTQYGYDDAGRLQQVIYPSGRTIQYRRDALGRIEAATATLGGQTQTVVEGIIYRADGQLAEMAFGNGTKETRQYDGLGRLAEQTLADGAGVTIKEQAYQYDNNGNITQRTVSGLAQMPTLTATYRYDALDRLTQETYDLYPERNATYTFDANGNRLTVEKGQGTNAVNEIYSYTANSNRLVDVDATWQEDKPAGPTKDFELDAKQRLKKLHTDGKVKSEYSYDVRNLRTKKAVYDGTGYVTETTDYHYDVTGLLIGEADGQGHAQREYVYLDGTPLAQIDVAGQQETITYLHTDHLATPRLATNAGQAVVWKWESDAYGTTAPTGSLTVSLRFPGQYFDAESGLHYNGNRYYDPWTGRYWTSDPVGLSGGMDTYAYVENNPSRWIDPAGLLKGKEGGGGGGGGGGWARCYLLFGIRMYYNYFDWLPGPKAMMYCVYDCNSNSTCPCQDNIISLIIPVWNPPYECPTTVDRHRRI